MTSATVNKYMTYIPKEYKTFRSKMTWLRLNYKAVKEAWKQDHVQEAF